MATRRKTPTKKRAPQRASAVDASQAKPTKHNLLSPVPANEAPDITKLPLRWQVFCHEYLIDFNGGQAATRAGFAAANAKSQASRLLSKPEVKAVIAALMEDRLEGIRMTRERVLDEFSLLAEADANELSQLRRVCCRHCHSERTIEPAGARAPQLTPHEHVLETEAWGKRRAALLANEDSDIGDYPHEPGNWYDRRKPIDPECPECHGDGVVLVFLQDTRTLSRRARALFAGAKEGKDGIEIKTHDKAGALSVLAKHHKLFDDFTKVSVTLDYEKLNTEYGETMRKAHERAAELRRERFGDGDTLMLATSGHHGNGDDA